MKIVYATKIVNGKKVRYPKVLEERYCKECSDWFVPKRDDSVFCSRKCGRKFERTKNKERYSTKSREWYNNNLEKARKARNEYYAKNRERELERKREWDRNNAERKAKTNQKYKDSKRHGNERGRAISIHGLTCERCGQTKDNSFDIVQHHKNFDKEDHVNQGLLCRSCHAKIHMRKNPNNLKPVSKDEIENALANSKSLYVACEKLGISRATLYDKRKKLGLI